MRFRRVTPLVVLGLIALLTGCGLGQGDDEPASTRVPSATATDDVGSADGHATADPDRATPSVALTPEIGGSAGTVAFAQGDARRTGHQPGPVPIGAPITRWQLALAGPVVAPPVLADGVLLVQSDGAAGTLIAVDADSGLELWQRRGGSAASPAISNGAVYAGTADGFGALDLRAGTSLWSFPARAGRWTSAIVAGGAVYVCDLANEVLFAFDAATGRQLWNLRGFNTPAAAVDGLVLAANSDALYALDAATGSVVWLKYMDAVGYPVIGEDGIYVVAKRLGTPTRYDLLALDDRGAEQWRAELGTGLPSSPVLASDGTLVYVAVVADDGTMRIHGLDQADGSLRSSVDTESTTVSELVVVGGWICFAADGGDYSVSALVPTTGASIWTFAGVRGTPTAPVVANGTIFVGSATPNGGLVMAIGATSAATPLASPVAG
jgi:outer membrane protein assembly factor BamB